MKLYVIRHGESQTNKNQCWTGWLDAPLTDKGISDAEGARAILADVKFDKVYSSDLARARRTAEVALGISEYETTPLLREINVGSLAGKPLSALDAELRKITSKGYAAIGGEDYSQLRERVSAFMKSIEGCEYENVAAFSHAGWLRSALSVVLDVSVPSKNFLCNNCTVAIFEYKNSVWRLHSWINK